MSDLSAAFSPTTLLATAQEAAGRAGELVRKKWSQPREVASKGFRDLVTDADFASQKVITDLILERFPEHGFLTEEDDRSLPTSGPILWVIDPIDGTTNYSRQQPNFCISIAAIMPAPEGQWRVTDSKASQVSGFTILAGVIFDPMRDEVFSAAVGQGAMLNGRPIQVSPIGDLEEAVIGLDWSHSPHRRQSALGALHLFAHHVFTIRALGSAALALAWIAAGRLDGYINFDLKPWDIAAASLLIQEAGGHLSHVKSHYYTWSVAGSDCVASNGRIHQGFLQLLAASGW